VCNDDNNQEMTLVSQTDLLKYILENQEEMDQDLLNMPIEYSMDKNEVHHDGELHEMASKKRGASLPHTSIFTFIIQDPNQSVTAEIKKFVISVNANTVALQAFR
jgi:hypothetical protein